MRNGICRWCGQIVYARWSGRAYDHNATLRTVAISYPCFGNGKMTRPYPPLPSTHEGAVRFDNCKDEQGTRRPE